MPVAVRAGPGGPQMTASHLRRLTIDLTQADGARPLDWQRQAPACFAGLLPLLRRPAWQHHIRTARLQASPPYRPSLRLPTPFPPLAASVLPEPVLQPLAPDAATGDAFEMPAIHPAYRCRPYRWAYGTCCVRPTNCWNGGRAREGGAGGPLSVECGRQEAPLHVGGCVGGRRRCLAAR